MIPDPTKMPPEEAELDGTTTEEQPLSETAEPFSGTPKRDTDMTLAMGVAIGVALGALFGTIWDNIALGVGVGIAVGVIAAYLYTQVKSSAS